MTKDDVTPPPEASGGPFIDFENVTLRVRERHILPATRWTIENHQSWAVLGPNGAGKSTLLRALKGSTPVVGGHIRRYGPHAQAEAIGFASFELHQELIAREQALDEARCFSGRLDSYLSVEQVIEEAGSRSLQNGLPVARLVSAFGIEKLLRRPVRKLSIGEMRKLLVLRAVMQTRQMLVLDEPFAGLDQESRGQLRAAIETLIQAGIQVVLATHRTENILPAISHVLFLKEGRVFRRGERDRVLTPENIGRVFGAKGTTPRAQQEEALPRLSASSRGPVLIEIRHASVRYGGVSVFSDLDWRVRKGENWVITGPNGCGKTTLLQMVSADHPQAYANEIYLFGRRRGSGESIWEIKRRMGLLSSELQINYRKASRSFDVVLSGFFSSVGLYRRASDRQRRIAREWIRRLNLSHLVDRRYDLLSFGERRMILLARAVVTTPEILVLDEPCQGLDLYHRQLILELIDEICDGRETQLLFVSHHLRDLPACVTHVLDVASQTSGRLPRRQVRRDL